MKKLAIFASGNGTNAVNITEFFNEGNRVRVDVVLVDRESAPVVQRMQTLGVDVFYFPRSVWRDQPGQIIDLLRSREIDLIALAGFNSLVAPEIVDAFKGRLLNIHPSLLPEFGGKGMWGHHVHEAVLAAGRTQSGCTVHYVDNDLDTGEILMQQKVDVMSDDTPDSLAERVHQAEYALYPRAIVEALRRIDAGPRTPDKEWAEALGIPDHMAKPAQSAQSTPPPVPGSQQAYGQQPQEQRNHNQPSETQPVQSTQDLNWMPYGAQPYGKSNVPSEPMPPTYLIWSIICTMLCCFIPGIVAIIFSSRVSSQYYSGDIDGARRSSRLAEIWIIASFCLGVLSATVYAPLTMLF